MGLNFCPQFYVEITEFFDDKKKAILANLTQMPEKLFNLTCLMNSYRSGQCNRPFGTYVEAYRCNTNFPFPDIRNCLPPPPVLQPFFENGSNSLV